MYAVHLPVEVHSGGQLHTLSRHAQHIHGCRPISHSIPHEYTHYVCEEQVGGKGNDAWKAEGRRYVCVRTVFNPPSFLFLFLFLLSLSPSPFSSVNITGTNLFGHGDNITMVTFGSEQANIDYSLSNNTLIRVRIQEIQENVTADTPVSIVITATTSAIVESSGNIWTYLVPGQIDMVSPNIGQNGTMLEITGKKIINLCHKHLSSFSCTHLNCVNQ